MAGIPARVTGILTIMLGARRSKSSACFTIASLSRYNRGSVWIESRPFLPFCCSKIGLSSAAALADISRTTCQAISSSLAIGNSFASAWILPFQTSNSFLRTLTTMTGLHVAPTAPFSSEYWSSEIEAESFQRQVGVVCVISWSRLLYVEVAGELIGRTLLRCDDLASTPFRQPALFSSERATLRLQRRARALSVRLHRSRWATDL